MDMLFTQDPAKGKRIVSYSEARAQSNNGPHLYLVCRSNARLPWEKLPFIKMKMIITLRASPSFQPFSYRELITYASIWIMHGAIDVSYFLLWWRRSSRQSLVILKSKLFKSLDLLMKPNFCRPSLKVCYQYVLDFKLGDRFKRRNNSLDDAFCSLTFYGCLSPVVFS